MTTIERASARASVRAANDNTPTRKQMLRIADQLIEANPETRELEPRVRYRGTRPAWNWLKKKDERAAAALWLFARERIPYEADNDNEPTAGMSAERRKDGRPRGRNPDPRSIEAYLAMPGVRMRFGDAETPRMTTDGWHSDVITIKPQRKPGDYPLHPRGSYTKCAPGIAYGALFMGAVGGLGQQKPGKRRGDIRPVDDIELPAVPDDVSNVIELILAGSDLSQIGRALGAKGGYADRRGAAAVTAAGKWAKAAIAA